jgi:hypothetical protein
VLHFGLEFRPHAGQWSGWLENNSDGGFHASNSVAVCGVRSTEPF